MTNAPIKEPFVWYEEPIVVEPEKTILIGDKKTRGYGRKEITGKVSVEEKSFVLTNY